MKRWLILSLILTVLAVSSSLWLYANRETLLPEQVPTHWGVTGEPDQFTPRDQMLTHLLLTPGVLVLMVLMGLVLPWLSPAQFKIEPFADTFYRILEMVQVLFTYLHGMLLAAYMGWLISVDRWLVGGMLLLLVPVGNLLGKVKRNFWMGVRTPWTLASETVWTRTHRLAAWLFVAGGLLGFVLVLVGVHPLVSLVVFLVAALVPVFYSLALYKYLESRGLLDQPQDQPATPVAANHPQNPSPPLGENRS